MVKYKPILELVMEGEIIEVPDSAIDLRINGCRFVESGKARFTITYLLPS